MLVGDTLIISHEQPFLQTQMVRTVTEEREIPYTTETEVDHNKESTYEEVVQQGQNGVEEIVSQITYIDGYETERTVLSETTVVEPVADQHPVQLQRFRHPVHRIQCRRLHLAGQRRLHHLPDLGLLQPYRHRHCRTGRHHHLGRQGRHRHLRRLVQRLWL